MHEFDIIIQYNRAMLQLLRRILVRDRFTAERVRRALSDERASTFPIVTMDELRYRENGMNSFRIAFVTDATKIGEEAGEGTGVPAFYNSDTDQWVRISDYQPITNEHVSGGTGSGVPGSDGDSVFLRFSTDNSNWHEAPASDDEYISFATAAARPADSSSDWGTGIKFVGDDGVAGSPGAPGSTGSAGSSVFIRFSSDNTNWHQTPTTADTHISFATALTRPIDTDSAWGTGIEFVGSGTSYPSGTSAQIVAGTDTTDRVWQADDLHLGISTRIGALRPANRQLPAPTNNASDARKVARLSNSGAGWLIGNPLDIHLLPEITELADDDFLVFADTSDSSALKKVKYGTIKSLLGGTTISVSGNTIVYRRAGTSVDQGLIYERS